MEKAKRMIKKVKKGSSKAENKKVDLRKVPLQLKSFNLVSVTA